LLLEMGKRGKERRNGEKRTVVMLFVTALLNFIVAVRVIVLATETVQISWPLLLPSRRPPC